MWIKFIVVIVDRFYSSKLYHNDFFYLLSQSERVANIFYRLAFATPIEGKAWSSWLEEWRPGGRPRGGGWSRRCSRPSCSGTASPRRLSTSTWYLGTTGQNYLNTYWRIFHLPHRCQSVCSTVYFCLLYRRILNYLVSSGSAFDIRIWMCGSKCSSSGKKRVRFRFSWKIFSIITRIQNPTRWRLFFWQCCLTYSIPLLCTFGLRICTHTISCCTVTELGLCKIIPPVVHSSAS